MPADIAAAVDQKYVAAVAAGIGHMGGSAIVQVQEERARVVLGRGGGASGALGLQHAGQRRRSTVGVAVTVKTRSMVENLA